MLYLLTIYILVMSRIYEEPMISYNLDSYMVSFIPYITAIQSRLHIHVCNLKRTYGVLLSEFLTPTFFMRSTGHLMHDISSRHDRRNAPTPNRANAGSSPQF